ncbi:MAG TPA: carbohydrate ABC transporter permease [Caproicibacter sp.]|nr:carbohydrate ABC transporter permease [Caproicibacter sp.]
MNKKRFSKDIPLIPAYILLILWLVFSVATIGWIFAASLSTTKEIFSNRLLTSGLHFDNYQKAWIGNNIAQYFLNSVIYSFVSCFGIILISAPAAYVIGRMQFRGRKLILNSFLVSMSVPSVMIVIPMFSIMSRLNMIGSMYTLIILYIASNVPFTVYFLISFFASLPGEMEDAALVDGCSQYKAFWRIILPLAQPGIITVGIFDFMAIWNEYFLSLVFANKSEIRSLSVGLQSMIQSMRYTGDWAGLFAAVIIVFLPTFILYLLLSEKIISGVTGGAVKG